MALFDNIANVKRWVFSQDRGKTLDRGILRTIGAGMDLVDETIEAVRNLSVLTAEGVYLDLYGRLVGLNRGALTDEVYAPAIVVEALSLFGSGDEGTITRLVRVIIGDVLPMSLQETGWGFVYKIPDIPVATAKLMSGLLSDVHALTYLGYVVTWEEPVMAFSSAHGAVTLSGWFSSVHGAVTDPAGWAHAIKL